MSQIAGNRASIASTRSSGGRLANPAFAPPLPTWRADQSLYRKGAGTGNDPTERV